MTKALQDVLAERARQDIRWSEQNHDPFLYLTILGEEYGETCQAALEARFTKNPMDEGVCSGSRTIIRATCTHSLTWPIS